MRFRTNWLLVLPAMTVLLAGLMTPASADDDVVEHSADWLTAELDDGLLHFPDTGEGEFDDYGMSLDVFFALDAADTDGDARDAILDAVAEHIDEYSSSPADKDGEAVYAGSTAKALVAAQRADRDPRDFGGVDLVDRLESTLDSHGKISDDSEFGDNANVIGQTFAVEGLAEAEADSAGDARDYLADLQCDSGAFTEQFDDDCEEPSLDTTARVIITLYRADSAGLSGVEDAVDSAADWLADEQDDDGAFSASYPESDANTNSTGLAATALALTGNDDAAGDAGDWIAEQQVTDDTGGDLDDQAGAIAYGPDALKAGKDDGITDDTLAQWRGATAQALLGLAHGYEGGGGLPIVAWIGIGVAIVVVLAAGVLIVARRSTR